MTSLNGDGYYILRLVDSNDTQVSYEFIKIPLTTFQRQLDALYDDGKIKIYIDVPFRDEQAGDVNE